MTHFIETYLHSKCQNVQSHVEWTLVCLPFKTAVYFILLIELINKWRYCSWSHVADRDDLSSVCSDGFSISPIQIKYQIFDMKLSRRGRGKKYCEKDRWTCLKIQVLSWPRLIFHHAPKLKMWMVITYLSNCLCSKGECHIGFAKGQESQQLWRKRSGSKTADPTKCTAKLPCLRGFLLQMEFLNFYTK